MDIIEGIYHRRAVKYFDGTHRLSSEEELKLLEATIQAPTSFNIQHWRFVILRDSALRAKIRAELGNDQLQITDASLLVLFTADVKAWNKNPERYCASAPKEVADMLINMITSFYDGRETLQRDEAQRSIGIAMQTLMLAAQNLGYQSCPMMGFDYEKMAELINLPDGYVIGPMVAIGIGIKPPWPKTNQLSLQDLIVEDAF